MYQEVVDEDECSLPILNHLNIVNVGNTILLQVNYLSKYIK